MHMLPKSQNSGFYKHSASKDFHIDYVMEDVPNPEDVCSHCTPYQVVMPLVCLSLDILPSGDSCYNGAWRCSVLSWSHCPLHTPQCHRYQVPMHSLEITLYHIICNNIIGDVPYSSTMHLVSVSSSAVPEVMTLMQKTPPLSPAQRAQSILTVILHVLKRSTTTSLRERCLSLEGILEMISFESHLNF